MENTKTELILAHLQKRKKITSLEAFEMYNATRLSVIIFNLKARGYEIVTQMVQDSKGIRWGVYRYLGVGDAKGK